MGLCLFGWSCSEAVDIVVDTAKGSAKDTAAMAVEMAIGTVELALQGELKATVAGVEAYIESEGSFSEKASAAANAHNRQRNSTMTMGFSEANNLEEAKQHAKNLTGISHLEASGRLLNEGIAEGDSEKIIEGTGRQPGETSVLSREY